MHLPPDARIKTAFDGIRGNTSRGVEGVDTLFELFFKLLINFLCQQEVLYEFVASRILQI